MSIPPAQASVTASENATRPRYRARKRRKYNHAKESIYLAPEVEPYPLAIKPEPSQPGPSRGYAPINDDGDEIETPEIRTVTSPRKENDKGKGKDKEQRGRGKDKNPLYQAAALKAWETKRQRQKERFEALEASSSLLSLGVLNYRDGMFIHASSSSADKVGISRSGSGSDGGMSMPALDPLLDLDWDEVSDVPNDVRSYHFTSSALTGRTYYNPSNRMQVDITPQTIYFLNLINESVTNDKAQVTPDQFPGRILR